MYDFITAKPEEKNVVIHDFRFYGHPLKQKRYNWACGDDKVYHKFAGVDVKVEEWDEDFKDIRNDLSDKFEVENLNFCLLNTYPSGKYSIAAHPDGELNATNKSIFTLSLGRTRIMKLVPGNKSVIFGVNVDSGESKEIKSNGGFVDIRGEIKKVKGLNELHFPLEHGDLFYMCGDVQSFVKHGIDEDLLISTKLTSPARSAVKDKAIKKTDENRRDSLTFRGANKRSV